MQLQLERALRAWLAAERAGAPEADFRLYALFQRLPRPAPAAGFADRVLARAGQASAAWAPLTPRQAQAAVAALLALAGLALVVLGGVALPLAGLVSPAAVLQLAARAVAGFCRFLAEGVVVWDKLSRAVAALLETPQTAVAMALCAAVSTLALRLLSDLILRERELHDARSV